MAHDVFNFGYSVDSFLKWVVHITESNLLHPNGNLEIIKANTLRNLDRNFSVVFIDDKNNQ